jgi:hypothetical protein
VNLSRRGYVGALICKQGLHYVHIVLKAASTECSAGSNDHFVVVGCANFHCCLVSLMWMKIGSNDITAQVQCLECLKNIFTCGDSKNSVALDCSVENQNFRILNFAPLFLCTTNGENAARNSKS